MSTLTRLNTLLAFLEQDPGNLPLYKDAIRVALHCGQLAIARNLVDAGLRAQPGAAALLALSGLVHLEAGEHPEAAQVLSAALAGGIEAPEVRYNLAFALFAQRRIYDALEALNMAGVCEFVPLALWLRARCHHHLGRREEAVTDCRGYLDVFPESADARGLLALLLHELDQNANAARHAEAALQQDPTQVDALLVRANLRSEAHDYDSARECFDTLLEAHPECGRGWLGRGLVKLSQMQTDSALPDIELAARYMPEHTGTWHVLAWIHLMRNEISAAQVAFQRALALDRNFAETHGGLGVIAVLEGRDIDAGSSIKRALRLDPNSLSARCAQVLRLHKDGHHAEARAILDAVDRRLH